ncbi:MAG: mechanosensitive ion channel domain-containing protein [Planctomycetota bacterium]
MLGRKRRSRRMLWGLWIVCLLGSAAPVRAGQEPHLPRQGSSKQSRQKRRYETRVERIKKDLAGLPADETGQRESLERERRLCEGGLSDLRRLEQLSADRVEPVPAVPEWKSAEPPSGEIDASSDPLELQLLAVRLDGIQKRLEGDRVRFGGIRDELSRRLRELGTEIQEAGSRTDAVLASEKKSATNRLGKVKQELSGEAEAEQQRLLELEREVLELKLDVLGQEAAGKTRWRKWLADTKRKFEDRLAFVENERLAPIRGELALVEKSLAAVQGRLLPPVHLPETADERIRTAFEGIRRRSAALIQKVAKAQQRLRELEAALRTLERARDEDRGEREKLLSGTASGTQTSTSVQYFKLKSGRRALTRKLRTVLANERWNTLAAEREVLEEKLRDSAAYRARIEARFRQELLDSLPTGTTRVPAAYRNEMRVWIDREKGPADELVLAHERSLGRVTDIQQVLVNHRDILAEGLKELERRGLFLRDPGLFSVRSLLRTPGLLTEQGKRIWDRLTQLPLSIVQQSARQSADASVWSPRLLVALCLPLLGILLFSFFRGVCARMRAELEKRIAAGDEPPGRLVQQLALFGWLWRLSLPAGLGAFFVVVAGLFPLLHEDGQLCEALGRLLVLTSVWTAAARVCLRPARPELRLFKLDDVQARWLHRLAGLGLAFWVLGLLGGVCGALIPGSEGQAVESSLAAFRNGGLLLTAGLFFLRQELSKQLFPRADEGGIRFLQPFVLLILWPARIAIAAALLLWLLAYHALASAVGMAVVGSLGSVIIAVSLHQTVHNEVWFRLVEQGDKKRPLLGEYLAILELLGSLLVAGLAFSWILGFDWSDWNHLAGVHLWGKEGSESEVQLSGLCLFFLAGYLTVAITSRSRRSVERLLEGRTSLDRGLRYTLGTMSGYVTFIFGALITFNFIHVGLEQLGWMMAALGVGIGFGLRDIVSNFFSGLILLFERPLQVGDIVKVGDVLGEVKKITIRSTTVSSFDNIDIIVPNKDFIASSITNWTASDRDMRSTLAVGVNYGADLKHVRKVLLDTVTKHGRVFEKPAPAIYVSSFGDSSINFSVVYWTSLDYKRSTFSDLHFAIDAAFKREGIEIPFPQQDLYLKPGGEIPVLVQSSAAKAEQTVTQAPQAAAPVDRPEAKKPAEKRRKRAKRPAKDRPEPTRSRDPGGSGGDGD